MVPRKILSVLLVLYSAVVSGQPVIPQSFPDASGYTGPSASKTIIKLDPFTHIPLGDIPFDREFDIRIYFNDGDPYPERVYIIESERTGVSNPQLQATPIPKGTTILGEDKLLAAYKALDVHIPALDPDKSYNLYYVNVSEDMIELDIKVFQLIFRGDSPTAIKSHIRNLATHHPWISEYEALLQYYTDHNLASIFRQTIPNDVKEQIITSLLRKNNRVKFTDSRGAIVTVNIVADGSALAEFGTSQGKIETSAAFRLVADAGVVYTGFHPGFSSIAPYVGIAYSFRALDSDIPFNRLKSRLKWWQRGSLNAALTVNSMAKAGYRANLFGTNNLMVGFGYKFSHVISATGGCLFYNNLVPNPLLDKKSLAVSLYLGLSVNLKIKTMLGDVAKIFTYGK